METGASAVSGAAMGIVDMAQAYRFASESIDLHQPKTELFTLIKAFPPQEPFMYKRILIATDGSELSDKAVESGLSLAALTGAAVVALKVVPRYPRSYFEGGLPVDASDIRRIENNGVMRRRPW